MPYPQLVIDLTPLRMLSGDDAAFMQEILEMIAVQSPQLIEKINQEFSDKDLAAVSKSAHKYKSSLQILGNQHLISMAQEIEDLAATGQLTERLAQLISQFNGISDQLLDIIREELILLTKGV